MAGELIDLVNDTTYVANIVPAVYTGTTQGSAVDLSQCELLTNAIVDSGAFISANITALTVQLEECATTNGTFTLIPGAGSLTTICTITATSQTLAIAGQRTQRYARLNAVTFTGTTASAGLSGVIIAQKKFTNPGTGISRSPSS